VEGEE
jgi:hypothetical protein